MYLFARTGYNIAMEANRLRVMASSPVPTEFGTFDMHVFRWDDAAIEGHVDSGLSRDHVALTVGNLHDEEDVLVRVHSECLTSEVFGSLKCDCRKQLTAAQEAISRAGRGIILYLRQEGRGIGLANKIRAYKLQSEGHDTVDANRLLGLPDDLRDYTSSSEMLKHLGVKSIRLLTNNPLKMEALRARGIVVERESIVCSTSFHSRSYLISKRDRMGHWLPTM